VAVFSHRADFTAPIKLEKSGGKNVARGLKIFKSGTFRDSLGDQYTWEPEHLQQMVFNFTMLRDRGTLPNVPVRLDHWPRTVEKIIGYFVDLRADNEFLFADLEITSAKGEQMLNEGTLRARSAEIGFYMDNDDSLFWPVVLGVAFVDLPAAEGLYSKADGPIPVLTDQENENMDINELVAAYYAQGLADAEAAQQQNFAAYYAQGLADAPKPVNDKAPAMFTIGGVQTADVSKVQAHITTLETAASEQAQNARKNFVAGLVKDNKMAATQKDAMTAFALTLSDEQYAAWTKGFEAAPVVPLFAAHGNGVSNVDGQSGDADEIEVFEGIVLSHQRSGMPQDEIEKTPSFQRLQQLKSKATA
jgi:hypothetical protein